MRRVLAIARNTFREAVRNKVLYSLLFFAIALILFALVIGRLSVSEEVRTIRDVGLFGVDLFGVVIAVFVGVNLLYKELDLKTVYTILPKPILRWEFVLGKWLGIVVTLALQIFVMACVLFATLGLQGAPPDVATAKAVWLLFVNVVVVTSVAVFFSAFSSPLLSGFFALGVFVVGRSTPDILQLAARSDAPTRTVLSTLARIVPNLHLFYPSGAIIGAERVSVHSRFVDAQYLLTTTTYGFAYSIAVLVLAMVIFSRRDFV